MSEIKRSLPSQGVKRSLPSQGVMKRLAPQIQTIESMVEHLRIKDLWYTSFIRKEESNNK